MSDTKYNGWTNYETWAVNLWMSNDQGSQEHAEEMARECYEETEGEEDRLETATAALRELLKSELEESIDSVLDTAHAQGTLISDLLGTALGEVNFHEIAEALIREEVDAEADAKTE